jgi:hypothetical protein
VATPTLPSILLNASEAASLLGLTSRQLSNYVLPRTIERQRERGETPIPFVKLGKRVMFRADDLQKWASGLAVVAQ